MHLHFTDMMLQNTRQFSVLERFSISHTSFTNGAASFGIIHEMSSSQWLCLQTNSVERSPHILFLFFGRSPNIEFTCSLRMFRAGFELLRILFGERRIILVNCKDI